MYNKATIVGRIGNKDVKTTRTGDKMVSLSIATNKKYLDKQGALKEKTTWHTVYYFNKLADIAEKIAHKGDVFVCEGEINNKKIDDGNNVRWQYSITGSELTKISSSKSETNGNQVDEAYPF